MKCTFCPRQSVVDLELKDGTLYFCDGCSAAFRRGVDMGRILESVTRRKVGVGRDGRKKAVKE